MSSKSDAAKPSKTGTKSSEISSQTRQEIEEALSLFDTAAGDATKVAVSDLKVILRALGFEPRKDDITAMTEMLNPNENGDVLRADVIAVVGAKMGEKDTHDEIERAFKLFDDDDTGAITLANLRRVAKELGENVNDEELKAMITEADSGTSGSVTPDDFMKIMKKTCLY